jgi:hypothetical protein
MSEMIGSRDPPWGCALTVTRWWAAIFGATASALGPSDGDCAGAAGARSIRACAPGRMSEMIGSRDPPWVALSPLHAGGRQHSARRHRRSVPATGIALERPALGSVDRSVRARQNERNDRQSRPAWVALSPLHAAGRQYSTRRHLHSVPATGIALERPALGSVD